MSGSTLGLYRPGTTVLHRLPAGAKLGGLLAAGIGSIWTRDPLTTTALLGIGLAGLAAARVPALVVLRQLRPLLVLAAVLAGFHVVVSGPEQAYVVVGVLLALVLLATVVTLTTRTTALVDVVVRVARPLRRIGLDVERFGLLLALGVRSVPVVIGLAEEVRDAQRARGLAASPTAFAVPLVVRSLRHADRVGEALAARGLDD